MTVNEQELVLACRRLIKFIRNCTRIETFEDMVGTINDVQSLLDRRELQMSKVDVAPFELWTLTSDQPKLKQYVSPCKRYRLEVSFTGFCTLFNYETGIKIVQCGDVDDAMGYAKKHSRGEKWTA